MTRFCHVHSWCLQPAFKRSEMWVFLLSHHSTQEESSFDSSGFSLIKRLRSARRFSRLTLCWPLEEHMPESQNVSCGFHSVSRSCGSLIVCSGTRMRRLSIMLFHQIRCEWRSTLLQPRPVSILWVKDVFFIPRYFLEHL